MILFGGRHRVRTSIDERLMPSVTIVVTGELDIATVAGLDAQIRKAERQTPHVVVKTYPFEFDQRF